MVIASALELLDEIGLEGLTVGRLANKLNVQAPAIYWHFKNKQELLDEMATAVLRSGSQQVDTKSHRRLGSWTMHYGKLLRRMLLQHRDGARIVSGTWLMDDSVYSSMETAIQKLTNEGFSPYQSVVALSTIYSYVVGCRRRGWLHAKIREGRRTKTPNENVRRTSSSIARPASQW